MAATLHAGIIPGAEAKKLYSYPTLPANSKKMLLGNGTWGNVYEHPTINNEWLDSDDSPVEVTDDNDHLVEGNKVRPFDWISIPWYTYDTLGHIIDIEATGVQITHPTVAAATGKPTANQTPAFGATFTVSQISRDSLGHVSAVTDRTVKIPNSAASSTAAGLMSANDKKNHDSLVSMFNGQWTTSIDASGCMVVKAANGATVFKIDKAGEW